VPRVVHVATDAVRIPVARDRVERVADRVLRAEHVRDALISITFVSDEKIAALNWQHLKHRGPTDVISFALEPLKRGEALVGDVYVAPGVARRNASAHGAGVREELLRLVVHGVLHVIGYDHPADDTRVRSPMWRRQERLLQSVLALA
jgi:probable rRNA maturation factor